MVELMNVGIKYYDEIEKSNTSYWISGVEAEGYKVLNTRTKKLSYSKAVRTGSGKKR